MYIMNKIKIKMRFFFKKAQYDTRRLGNFKRCSSVHFLLAIYCWAWGLPLRVVFFPRETQLEKSYFPFASDY